MKRQLIAAAVAALVVLMAVPAQAAPWKLQALPDADMFCGAGLTQVDGFTGNPNGGSLWIDDETYGGHYVIVTSDHYLVPGVLLSAPQEDLSGFIPLGARYFGEKTGTTDRIDCQVVSRWDFPGDGGDFTVIAPIELARVS